MLLKLYKTVTLVFQKLGLITLQYCIGFAIHQLIFFSFPSLYRDIDVFYSLFYSLIYIFWLLSNGHLKYLLKLEKCTIS